MLRVVLRYQVVAALLAVLFLRTCDAQVISVAQIPGMPGGQSSLAAGELNANSNDGSEVAVVTVDGIVSVIRADGTVMWSKETPNRGCPFSSPNDKVFSSPSIGALFGDGVQYVVVGYGGFRGKACDGGVVAYRARDGEVAWTFSIQRWARKRGYDAFRNSVYGRPTLSDVDGDGKLEVGFGAFDRNVYLLNSNGSVRWFYNAADTVFSSPAFTDIDENGSKEMLIGTDISQNTRISPPTPNGGYLYALRTSRPRSSLRFQFRDLNLQVWRTEFDQVVQSSPVVAELVADNPGLEVVIGTGCFFPQGGTDRRGKYFRVLSAKSGKVLRTLPVSACTPATPAVGDIDGDGVLDVVVTVSGDASTGGDGRSHVLAWKPEADTVVWDVEPSLAGRTDRFGGHFNRSAVIADVTGDGRAEVTVASGNGVVILEGSTGNHLTCTSKPCARPTLSTEGSVTGTPIVADTNNDGRVEVMVPSRVGRAVVLVKWEAIFE